MFAHLTVTQGDLRLVDLDVMDGVEATVSVAIRTAIRRSLRGIIGFNDISRASIGKEKRAPSHIGKMRD